MPEAQPWHEHVRFETDTVAEAAKARRMVIIAAVAAVLAVVGLIVAFTGPAVLGWILFGIALLIALLYAYLASVTRKLAGLRGDDLIDVVVADEGIRSPGGLQIPWADIESIEIMGVDLTPRRRNGVVPVLAQHATNTALENADLGSKTSIMTVYLRDYDRVSERATTPVQRNVLTAPKSDRSGSVLVPLGSRDELQIDLLVDALAKYGMPNGVPIGYLPA